MTDEHKKLLTEEVLGECWHERRTEDVGKKPWDLSHCVKCGELVKLQSFDRRTFDNAADMMALFRKLVDNDEFRKFRYDTWLKGETVNAQNPITEWLFYNPERFCCLVAQWLEEKNEKI